MTKYEREREKERERGGEIVRSLLHKLPRRPRFEEAFQLVKLN
jgi:hypothetical protein